MTEEPCAHCYHQTWLVTNGDLDYILEMCCHCGNETVRTVKHEPCTWVSPKLGPFYQPQAYL
jgi:hypothetical protein